MREKLNYSHVVRCELIGENAFVAVDRNGNVEIPSSVTPLPLLTIAHNRKRTKELNCFRCTHGRAQKTHNYCEEQLVM